MKKIQFLIDYNGHKAGHVIGTKDSDAALLVNAGIAKEVGEHVRPLAYALDKPLQSECVAPVIDEVEASPKGALLPEELQEYITPSKQTTKANKKQTK